MNYHYRNLEKEVSAEGGRESFKLGLKIPFPFVMSRTSDLGFYRKREKGNFILFF